MELSETDSFPTAPISRLARGSGFGFSRGDNVPMHPSSLDAGGVALPAAPLVWPDARTMFGTAFELGLERRAKYALRLALTRKVRERLLREFAGMGFAEALFRREPRAFYPLMNHLVDRRLGPQARLRMTLASLRVVCGGLGEPARVQRLLDAGLPLLALDDGTRIACRLLEGRAGGDQPPFGHAGIGPGLRPRAGFQRSLSRNCRWISTSARSGRYRRARSAGSAGGTRRGRT